MSALVIAAEEGYTNCARTLLEARADVDGRDPANGWKVIWTPLMLACDFGHVKCVDLLLVHGANVNLALQDVEKGEPSTALQFAEDGEACERGGKRCAIALKSHEVLVA